MAKNKLLGLKVADVDDGYTFEYPTPYYRQLLCPTCKKGFDSHTMMMGKDQVCPSCGGRLTTRSGLEIQALREENKRKGITSAAKDKTEWCDARKTDGGKTLECTKPLGHDSPCSFEPSKKKKKKVASDYKLKAKVDAAGTTVTFTEGKSSTPSIHARLEYGDIEGIAKLPANGGVYGWRDEQGIHWEASHDENGLVHIVCMSSIRSSANGYIPLKALSIDMVGPEENWGKPIKDNLHPDQEIESSDKTSAQAVDDEDIPVWVYDNGGETADRYTIIFTETGREGTTGSWVYDAVGAGSGIYQHTLAKPTALLGNKVSIYDLPADIQEHIFQELQDMDPWGEPESRGDMDEPPNLEASHSAAIDTDDRSMVMQEWEQQHPHPTGEELIEGFNDGVVDSSKVVERILDDYDNRLSETGEEPDAEEFTTFINSYWREEIWPDLWKEIENQLYNGLAQRHGGGHEGSVKTAEGIQNELAQAGVAIDGGMITLDEGAAPVTTPMKNAAAHHTFVQKKNQVDNPGCAVCGGKYNASQHTRSETYKESKGPAVDEQEVIQGWEGSYPIAVTRGANPSDPNTPMVMFTGEWESANDVATDEQLAKIFSAKGRYDFYDGQGDGGGEPYIFMGEGTLAKGEKLIEYFEEKFTEWQEQEFERQDQEEDEHTSSETKEANSMSTLTPFTKTDWYGFAGAEKFEDGSEPLLAEIQVTNWPEPDFEDGSKPLAEVILIVDGNGVSLNGMNGSFNRDTGGGKDAAIALAQDLLLEQPIDVTLLLDQHGWYNANLPDSFTPDENPAPGSAAGVKRPEGQVGPAEPSGSDAAYKHTGAVGEDMARKLLEEAAAALREYCEDLNIGNPLGMKIETFLKTPKTSAKTAGPLNVDNPGQAFQDNPDKYLVHVASESLEGLVGGKVHYTDAKSHKAAEAALTKLLAKVGIQHGEFTQLGYDDVSFEVSDQKTAVKAVNYLNKTLPKSSNLQGGYGYGTAMPAQAAGYVQDSDMSEGEEYTHPSEWVYPKGEL